MTSLPKVCVLVSILNEERHLPDLLEQIEAQSYAGPIEVVIADGGSTDRSRDVIGAAAASHRFPVSLLDNPGRIPASGFNLGLASTEADIIVLLGGHMQLPVNYVERVVALLDRPGVQCAGGVIRTEGATATGRAIARAMSSPFGVGRANFRTGADRAGPTDTVAFGAYWKSMLQSLGGFDQSLIGAEDDELNFRIRRSGGLIWLDPDISCTYFCRESLSGLFRQYFGYGRGKAKVLRKHHWLPSLRAVTPSAFVVGVACAAATAIVVRSAWPVIAVVGMYAGTAVAFAIRAGSVEPPSVPVVFAAFATMHVAYGVGFLRGVFAPPPSRIAPPSVGSAPESSMANGAAVIAGDVPRGRVDISSTVARPLTEAIVDLGRHGPVEDVSDNRVDDRVATDHVREGD